MYARLSQLCSMALVAGFLGFVLTSTSEGVAPTSSSGGVSSAARVGTPNLPPPNGARTDTPPPQTDAASLARLRAIHEAAAEKGNVRVFSRARPALGKQPISGDQVRPARPPLPAVTAKPAAPAPVRETRVLPVPSNGLPNMGPQNTVVPNSARSVLGEPRERESRRPGIVKQDSSRRRKSRRRANRVRQRCRGRRCRGDRRAVSRPRPYRYRY